MNKTENLRLLALRQPLLHKRVTEYLGAEPKYFIAPETIIDDDVSGIDTLYSEIVFFFGLGNGQQLERITKKIPRYQVHVVIDCDLEPFIHYINNYDYAAQLPKGTTFICGESDQEKIFNFISQFFWPFITNKYTVIVNRKGITNFEWYQKFWYALQLRLNEYLMSINTTRGNAGVMLSNIIANIPNVQKHGGVEQYRDKYKGACAVVCCAGPSLQNDLEAIRAAAGRVIVIAVDTAMRPLVQAGINPHFCITIDFSEPNLLKFKNVSFGNTVTVILPSVMPETYKAIDGPKVSFFIPANVYQMIAACFGNRGVMECGGTVANGAYHLARLLGCNRIIFSGLDLAFVGGKTHVSGSMYDDFKYPKMGEMLVDSNDGGKVATSPDMWSFVPAFEHLFARESEKNITRVSTSAHGAAIKGLAVISIREAIDTLLSPSDYIEPVECQGAEESVPEAAKIILGGLIDQFTKISAIAARGEAACDYLITLAGLSHFDLEKIKNQSKNVSKIVSELSEMSAMQDFIEALLLDITYEFQKEMDSKDLYYPTKETIPDTQRKVKTFFTKTKKLCQEYTQKINNALREISS